MKNKKSKSKRKGFVLPLAAGVLLILVLIIVYAVFRQNREEHADKIEREELVEFPYISEDGGVQVTSLMQFTGPNPDSENTDGEDIAGIQVKNISDQYLKEAELVLQMDDTSEYTFLVKDLPAGSETVAFELENQSYDGQTACRKIQCTAQMSDTSMREDAVQITVDGSKLIITNITEQQIDNAAVIYRCTTGDSYIGGVSYEIPVSGLASGESFEYEDTACIFGSPQAVGVEID